MSRRRVAGLGDLASGGRSDLPPRLVQCLPGRGHPSTPLFPGALVEPPVPGFFLQQDQLRFHDNEYAGRV